MKLSRLVLAAALIAIPVGAMFAQSSPNWVLGYVPTPAEWNLWWTKKVDVTNGVLNSPTIKGNVEIAPSGPLAVAANVPLEGFYTSGGGPLVAMCPGYDFGCPATGIINAQTATVGTSLGDAGTQESEFYSYLVNKTGEALPWQVAHTYAKGTVVIGDSNQNLYVETAASCNSAGTGGGPIGKTTGIHDSTCVWDYHGEPGLRGKIAIASTTLVLPGGTDAWAGAFDTFIEPGWKDAYATGIEVDITNNSGRDAVPGGPLTLNELYLGGSVGFDPITAIVSISPFGTMGANFMSHEGIWIQGATTIKDHDFRVSTHSQVAFFDDASSVHSTSSYFDASTSPSGILLEGNYTSGNALVANNTIAAFATKPGQNFTGFSVNNAGTTPDTTDANITLNTGNANSYARFDLFDSNSLNIQTGSANINGITLGALAGDINLNPVAGTIKTNGVAGVTCLAGTVNLSTMTVANGLITHC